ncbi:MAG: TVP38/TMEM64 family protein [Firmicutes bacterium]|nr:TVP38/TMEM64 family protein [Bacillota bacterium]
MGSFLNEIYNYIITLINSSVIFGPLLACLLIFLESILPILPLFVFITIVFVAYGHIFGFIISYILTCLGCIFAFYLCRKFLKNFFEKKIRKIDNLDNLMKKLDKIKLSSLVILIAIPFTPAFAINIAASLSKIQFKKFLFAIIIGKISLVTFWGYIGTSLLESLRNPKILLVIISMLLIAFILSKIVTKKLEIE